MDIFDRDTAPVEGTPALRDGVTSHDASERSLTNAEAARRLRSRAAGKAGAVPVDVIVGLVLAATAGAGWPVRLAALEAVLRRAVSARSLTIAERPRGVLGTYATCASERRPYRTLLSSIDPLRGSCSCPDFVRASLGMCKHLYAVLDDVHAAGSSRARPAPAAPSLRWNPLTPLHGADDALARLHWDETATRLGRPSMRRLRVRGYFRRGPIVVPTAPRARLALVDDLLALDDAEPAARTVLEDERAKLRAVLDGLNGDAADVALRGLKRKLYPYQREGVLRFLELGRLVLADDMGLGKTAQAIASCHALFVAGKVNRGIVIVPASLKPQWLQEWQTFSDVPVAVVDGTPDERVLAYRAARRGFLIVNYEQLLRDHAALVEAAPDIVVLDEAQRMKTWSTQTALAVHRLRAPRRLALTGTPMENRLDELASIVSWVDDRALEPKWRLAPHHAVHVDGSKAIEGARHLDSLRARIAPVLLRRLRDEVLEHLPPRTDTQVPVAFTPGQQEAHAPYDQPIRQLLSTSQRRPLTRPEFLRLMSMLTRQRVICDGLVLHEFEQRWPALRKKRRPSGLLDELGSPKLGAIRSLVREIAVVQRRRVVVFSQWRRMLELIEWACRDDLAKAGVRAVFFTGNEKRRRREHNLVDFNDDEKTRVFLASDAGGVGLNLQHAASACINVEPPWNPAVLEQRIGRVHRNGQRHAVEAFHVVTTGGLEAHVRELVADKRALFHGLFDSDHDEVTFANAGTFLANLRQVVDAPAPSPAPALVRASRVDDTSAPTAGVSTEPIDGGRMLAGLRVTTGADGAITIHAPGEVASTLASLLRGLADALAP